jgi:hypothetical protein
MRLDLASKIGRATKAPYWRASRQAPTVQFERKTSRPTLPSSREFGQRAQATAGSGKVQSGNAGGDDPTGAITTVNATTSALTYQPSERPF